MKAVGQGLVPELDDLVDFAPQDFEIVGTEDEGVTVSRFDEDAEENVVVSERLWLVTMQASDQLDELPTEFTFADPILDVKEAIYQRYNDADLASVDPVISLEQEYGETSYLAEIMLGAGIGGLGLLLGIGCLVIVLTRKPATTSEGLQLPEEITPFSVLGLLKQIEHNNGFSDEGKVELAKSIHHIEAYYFDQSQGDEPDLRAIAQTWLQRS